MGSEQHGRYHGLSSLSAKRGVWLGAVAYAVALWATLNLHDPPARGWAMVLLISAGIAGVGAWSRQRWAFPFETHLPALSLTGQHNRRAFSFVGILSAGGVSLLAGAQWNAHPAETFGLAGWLWILSMLLLVISAASWPHSGLTPRAARPSTSMRSIGEVSWGKILPRVRGPWLAPRSKELIPVDGPILARRVDDLGSQRWPVWEIAAFAGVAALSFGLRLWDLAHFPFAIHSDEIITGRIATVGFGGPVQISIFSTTWYGIDLPALWFKGVQTSLQAGGYTLAALRLPAALFGAATVFPVYGLIRGIWGRAAALAGGAIIAVSASNIHFSRVTLNNIVTPFFWATCFYFILRGLRTRRPLDWALAGIAGGLSEHFYYGTRLLFMILIVFACYLLVFHWRQGWTYLGQFTLAALGFVVAFGPLLFYFLHNPGLYFGRGASVLTWNHIPNSWDDLALMWNTLWPLIQQNLLTFSTFPANDSVYFGSLLMPLEAALLVLGTALLIWRWRHPAAFLMLLAGVSVLFIGGTLVPGPGFIAHWTPAFPVFYVAMAIPVGAWAALGWKALPGMWRAIIPATTLAVLALVAYLNVDFYFNHYYAIRPEFEIRAYQSRLQAGLGTDYIVRNVGTTWQPYDPETNSYLIKGQDGAQITDPAHELPVPNPQGKGLAFFFLPDNEQNLPLVKSLYQGGTLHEILAHDGKTHLFYIYELTPEQVRSRSTSARPTPSINLAP